MKFIHIADLHLDRPFISLRGNKELSKMRKLEQKYNLRKVIDYINEHEIDFLFIPGDLFEQKFVTDDTIQYLIACFKEIPSTKIFITPGNHDPLIPTSPYLHFKFPSNVKIFGSNVESCEYDNIVIYGVGFSNYYMDSKVIPTIQVDKSKCNILVTHATLNGAESKYHDVKESELTQFDYVALGHIHQKKIDNSGIIYPGSLTSCGFDEPGEHGMVEGEITKVDGKYKIDYHFTKIDETEFERIEIDISNINSSTELIQKLDLKNNIYKIILTGERHFDTSSIEEDLKLSNKKVCVVEDESHVKYDLEQISKEDSLKGIFTKNILDEIQNHPDDKQKYMGALELVLKYMNSK